MKPFLLTISALLIAHISFGQGKFLPGYIVNCNNDTVYGELKNYKFNTNAQYCVFREEANNTPTTYQPANINSYRFNDGKYYISKNIDTANNTLVFLECIIEGAFNGYYYVDKDNTSRYFIEKGNKLIELKGGFFRFIASDGREYKAYREWYKNTLNLLLVDWEEISDQTSSMKLNHNSLINLGKQYSEFKCTDCYVYEKEKQPFFSNFGVSAGYRVSQINLKTGDSGFITYEHTISSNPITFGMNAKIPIYRINERTHFVTEFEIETAEYKLKTKQFSFDSTLINIKYTAFSFPSLSIQYYFTQRKISPYIRPKAIFCLTKMQEQSILNYSAGVEFENDYKKPNIKGKVNFSLGAGIGLYQEKKELGALEINAGYGIFLSFVKIPEYYIGTTLFVNIH